MEVSDFVFGCVKCNAPALLRAGIRWDNVVEKMRKDSGGDQEEVLSLEKFGGYKTEVREIIE